MAVVESQTMTQSMTHLCWRLTRIILVGSLGVSLLRAVEPVPMPDTIAGKRLNAFFKATGSGREDAYLELYRDHYEPKAEDLETRMAKGRKAHESWGHLTPRIILFERDLSLVVLAESTGPVRWKRCEAILNRKAPHRLAGVGILDAVPPELSWQHYQLRPLKEVVKPLRRELNVPALALATVKDGVITTAISGTRRVDKDDPVTMNDKFHIGSVTKSMTATLIGLLVEDGRLDWNDTLGKLLPSMDMLPVFREVTIEQLLQHQAGLPSYFTTKFFEVAGSGSPTAKRAIFVAELLGQEPVHDPGTRYMYSNAGYSVAGHVAETVAGQPFEKLMQKRLFAPLKMNHTGFGYPATPDQGDQPHGHQSSEDGWKVLDVNHVFPDVPSPGGNVHCSIEDLARYAAAHLDGLRGKDGLLTAATFQRLHKPMTNKSYYASGWWITGMGTPDQHMHGGSGGSFLAHVLIEPESNLAVVSLTNARQLQMEQLARTIADGLR